MKGGTNMVRDATQMEEETCIQVLEGLAELAQKYRATPAIMSAVSVSAISISAQLVYGLNHEQREQLNTLLANSVHETIKTFLKVMK